MFLFFLKIISAKTLSNNYQNYHGIIMIFFSFLSLMNSQLWFVYFVDLFLSFIFFENTFSMSSIHASRSIPKSMNAQSIPSLLYSSCSRTNMWWLKNCWSFSLVKLMQSCSNPLNYFFQFYVCFFCKIQNKKGKKKKQIMK